MELFLTLFALWSAIVWVARYLLKSRRRRRSWQPARWLKEINGVEYYRRLPAAQFESLAMQAMRARGFTLLGDPYLGRSKEQGYAWKRGKKVVFVDHPESSLSPAELDRIARELGAARAEQAIVFFPYSKAPATHHAGIDILAGKRLLNWFAILENVAPPIAARVPAEKCQCGAPMRERISRAGLPLLVCSMLPDCREVRQPDRATWKLRGAHLPVAGRA